MNIWVVIPAYNEEYMIASVLRAIPKSIKGYGRIHIVVIDDGSKDKTYKAASKYALVLKHGINRGLGAAITTGFRFAKEQKADVMVTFDADGQHRGEDILRLIKPILKQKADVVIGSRLIKNNTMPMPRKIINWLSNIVTYAFFGVWVTDSQSGLRAFSRQAINGISLRTQHMEVSSEIFKEIKRNNLSLSEISIPAIYTSYSLSKGQKITNASNIFWKLFLRLVR